MVGDLASEPAKCWVYLRGLGRLLRVERDCTERPKENAPDAGQGIEGIESNPYQEKDT